MARAPVLVANHPVRIAAERHGVNPTLIVQRAKGWIKCREEGVCRMCKRPDDVRPLTRHHLIAQAYFRRRPKIAPLRHCDANIVPLCEPCHKQVDAFSEERARIELRRSLNSVEVAFIIQVAGQFFLDRRYPSYPSRRSPVNEGG